MATSPKARFQDFELIATPEGFEVRDANGASIGALSPLEAEIWRRSDGATSVAAIAAGVTHAFPQTKLETIWAALDTLGDLGLLEARVAPAATVPAASRRRILTRVALALAGAGAAPALAAAATETTPAAQEAANKKSQEHQNKLQQKNQEKSQKQQAQEATQKEKSQERAAKQTRNAEESQKRQAEAAQKSAHEKAQAEQTQKAQQLPKTDGGGGN